MADLINMNPEDNTTLYKNNKKLAPSNLKRKPKTKNAKKMNDLEEWMSEWVLI